MRARDGDVMGGGGGESARSRRRRRGPSAGRRGAEPRAPQARGARAGTPLPRSPRAAPRSDSGLCVRLRFSAGREWTWSACACARARGAAWAVGAGRAQEAGRGPSCRRPPCGPARDAEARMWARSPSRCLCDGAAPPATLPVLRLQVPIAGTRERAGCGFFLAGGGAAVSSSPRRGGRFSPTNGFSSDRKSTRLNSSH